MDDDNGWKDVKEGLGCLVWILVFLAGWLVLSNLDALNTFVGHWLGAHS